LERHVRFPNFGMLRLLERHVKFPLLFWFTNFGILRLLDRLARFLKLEILILVRCPCSRMFRPLERLARFRCKLLERNPRLLEMLLRFPNFLRFQGEAFNLHDMLPGWW
jgi:hypothetical protein